MTKYDPSLPRIFAVRLGSSCQPWLFLSFFFASSQALAQGEAAPGEPGAPPTAAPPAPYAPPAQSGAPARDVNSDLPSSSQPTNGGRGDSFDFRPGGGETTIVTGGSDGSVDYQLGEAADLKLGSFRQGTASRSNVPEFHMVKKGDTLWDISNVHFQNPWEWPRVWSLNPQVENPHWIYPGDQLRLARTVESPGVVTSEDNSAGAGGFIGRDRIVPAGTIFLRDQGYIGDPERDVWGEVAGAKEEKMLLMEQDSLYLLIKEGVDLRLGQRLTVFREIGKPGSVDGARKPPGELVKVYGTVRIDAWDRDTRIAKAKIIEGVDVIERGAKVGPVGRRFDVVPPRKATAEVEARVIDALYPHVILGQYQVLFIDKGKEDGLVPGNRLRVLRHGDAWRHEITATSRHARTRAPLESRDEAPNETTPLRGDDDTFPDEIVGEVMVLRTEEYSSVCMVTETSRALTVGDRLLSTVGY